MMQDWDTRIETLKVNIENARKRWVLPFLEEVKEDKKIPENELEQEKAEDSKEEAKPSEELKAEDAKEEAKPSEKKSKGRKKVKEVKPDLIAIELAELEAIDEETLTEEQEDRLMELRRIRTQRAMNQEADAGFQEEMQKADEEIKNLKSELNIKEKLPKGYVE